MKKTLSLLLVLAMVLSSFSFAFATEAEKTPGEVLKEMGVLAGNAEGDLMLDKELSRQDMIVLLSRLLGAEDQAKAFEGKTSFTDVKDPYYVPFMAWAEANKLINGVGEGLFGFNRPVTEKEVATLMLRALGYTDVKWEDVAAKAVELGLVAKDADLDVNCVRGIMAEITLKALATKVNGEEKTLAEKLGLELPKPAVVDATKVESVSATNLKEVVVEFDGIVDKDSAENADNYVLNNSAVVKSATLADDAKSVLLTVDGTGLKNQDEYKLNVKNVKAKNATISAKDFKFTPLDVTLPEVEKVEALGNKAVKVTFTEPVQKSEVSISDFKLDDKSIAGSYDADDSRSVIVRVYTKLADGAHTITVSGIKDFAGYTIVKNSYDFDVVEDKDAPSIVSVEATFEYVTVKFSEPVQNVKGGSYAYWKQTESSAAKYTAATNVVKLADDTYEFEFTGSNKLPGYEVVLYINGVKDYSDNVIAKDAPVVVKANIDQTRPEVVSVELNEDNYKSIVVKFSKAIANLTTRAKYSLKDADGDIVSIRSIEASDSDKTATINLYSALEEGSYVLKIEGLKDKTTLANVILPFETALEVEDAVAPTVDSVSKDGRYIVINFSEVMSLDGDGSIANLNNYLIQYNGGFRALPAGTTLEVLSGAESVMLIMPEKIGTVAYDSSKLTAVTIQRVEDANGNVLDNYSYTATSLTSTFAIAKDSNDRDNVTLKDSTTVVAVFNQDIGTDLDASDFSIVSGSAVKVESVEVDANKVTLTLDKDVYATFAADGETPNVQLAITAKGFKSVLGTEVSAQTVAIIDKVKPELYLEDGQSALNVTATSGAFNIEVKFTENLNNKNWDAMATDFVVKRVNGDVTLNPIDDYNTVMGATQDTVIIQLKSTSTKVAGKDSIYTVQLKDAPTFVVDVKGNKAVAFNAFPTEDINLAPPTVELAADSDAKNLKLTLSETATISVTAEGTTWVGATAGTEKITSETAATSGQVVKFTVTDEDGNSKAYTATYTTSWAVVAD